MCAKILQMVNSAFFGLPRQVTSPVKAVQFLGLDTVKALILSVKVFSMLSHSDFAHYSVDELWRHSLGAGLCSKEIAKTENWGQELLDEAFTAGLLHDVGKLILVDKFPAECLEVVKRINNETRLYEAEQEVFGTTHAQVGAYLLGIWGLSGSIIKTVAWHHTPGSCPAPFPTTLAAVHLADFFDCEKPSTPKMGSGPKLDTQYVDTMGIADRITIWRTLCARKQGEGDARKDSLR